MLRLNDVVSHANAALYLRIIVPDAAAFLSHVVTAQNGARSDTAASKLNSYQNEQTKLCELREHNFPARAKRQP